MALSIANNGDGGKQPLGDRCPQIKQLQKRGKNPIGTHTHEQLWSTHSHRSSRNDGSRNEERETTFEMHFYPTATKMFPRSGTGTVFPGRERPLHSRSTVTKGPRQWYLKIKRMCHLMMKDGCCQDAHGGDAGDGNSPMAVLRLDGGEEAKGGGRAWWGWWTETGWGRGDNSGIGGASSLSNGLGLEPSTGGA